MSNQSALLPSILKMKCPRCHEGDMFPKGTLYSSKFADMHPYCPCCGQNLEPEPGYYFGAMYVSFAFNVGIFLVAFFLLNHLVEEVTTLMMLGLVVGVV